MRLMIIVILDYIKALDHVTRDGVQFLVCVLPGVEVASCLNHVSNTTYIFCLYDI